MTAAIAVGLACTVVALFGLLGRPSDGRPWPSQVVVIAMPLGIIAGGYAASVGATLLWCVVAVLSVFLAVLAGSLLGRQGAMHGDAQQSGRPAAAGLTLAFSALIALGLAVIVVQWAGHLIGSFANLQSGVVKAVLVLAAIAYGIGGRAVRGLSRIVLVLLILGALGMLAAGVLLGDIGTLTDPQIPVPAVSAGAAIAYAVGVVLIGAGFPVLREAAHQNRGASIIAAAVVSLVVLAYLIGMLALYGGSFSLPSLVVNVLPSNLPPFAGVVICGLVAIVSTVIAGACIHAASEATARIVPSWYADTEHHRGPLRAVAFAMGLAVFIIAFGSPTPVAVVAVLSVLGAANLITEWILSRGGTATEDAEATPEPSEVQGVA